MTINKYVQNRMNTKKVKMLIAIDSKSNSRTIDRDGILDEFGFYRESPNKGLPLPESTYIGEVDSEEAGKKLIQEIWDTLKDEGLEPTRISGGIVQDWKVICDINEVS